MTIQGPETGLVGDSLTFRCLVNNANPAPDVQWVVNGRQVRLKNALLNLSGSFIRVDMISDILLIDGILQFILFNAGLFFKNELYFYVISQPLADRALVGLDPRANFVAPSYGAI